MDLGWVLRSLDDPPTGHALLDRIKADLKRDQAAKESALIVTRTGSGRRRATLEGYWATGEAPFPAVRVDAATNRVLPRAQYDSLGRRVANAERSTPGNRVVLGPDTDSVAAWERMAQMLVDGQTFAEILRYANEHIPTRWGRARWAKASSGEHIHKSSIDRSAQPAD